MIVPYQAFAAADGYMMVAAGNDNLFRRLAAVLDRPGLAEDPRFAQQQGPRRPPRRLVPILRRHLRHEAARRMGAAARRRRASRTGRSTRSTRSSPTRRPQALGIIQTQARQRNSAWSACRCRSTGSGRLSTRPRRRSAKTTNADSSAELLVRSPLLPPPAADGARRPAAIAPPAARPAAVANAVTAADRAGRPLHRA